MSDYGSQQYSNLAESIFISAVGQAVRDLRSCPLEDRTSAWMLDRIDYIAQHLCREAES